MLPWAKVGLSMTSARCPLLVGCNAKHDRMMPEDWKEKVGRQPNFFAAASKTRTPSGTTSLPMPRNSHGTQRRSDPGARNNGNAIDVVGGHRVFPRRRVRVDVIANRAAAKWIANKPAADPGTFDLGTAH